MHFCHFEQENNQSKILKSELCFELLIYYYYFFLLHTNCAKKKTLLGEEFGFVLNYGTEVCNYDVTFSLVTW